MSELVLRKRAAEAVTLAVRVSPEVAEKLREASKRTGYTLASIVEVATGKYLPELLANAPALPADPPATKKEKVKKAKNGESPAPSTTP